VSKGNDIFKTMVPEEYPLMYLSWHM